MPKFKMTVSHAAENGTRRDLLVALRSRLAQALEDDRTQPRDLSPLSLRLRELQAEIESLDMTEQQEAADRETADEPFNTDDL